MTHLTLEALAVAIINDPTFDIIGDFIDGYMLCIDDEIPDYIDDCVTNFVSKIENEFYHLNISDHHIELCKIAENLLISAI